MADTDAARIGDVKGGLEAAKTDANRRLRRDGSNVDMTPEQAAAFRAAIGAGGGGGGSSPPFAISDTTGLQDALDARQLLTVKNQPGGYAGLDGSGKLLTSALPALALTEIFEVSNQTAMLALVAQIGDIAIRTDQNKTYALAAEPSSTLGNWKELRTPTDVVQSVAGLTGAITAAALKAALSLVKGDVGLGNVDNTSDANKPVSTAQQAALDLKANISDTIISVTTSRNLAATDNGKVLEVDSATDVTLTVPSSLAAGFNCVVSQIGAGKAIIAAGSGASVNAMGGAKTAGQWADLSVRVRGTAGAAVVSGGVA